MPMAATASTTASAEGARRPRVKPKNASGSATTAAAAISALFSDATMAASAIFVDSDGSTISAAASAAAAAITSASNFATAATKPMLAALVVSPGRVFSAGNVRLRSPTAL